MTLVTNIVIVNQQTNKSPPNHKASNVSSLGNTLGNTLIDNRQSKFTLHRAEARRRGLYSGVFVGVGCLSMHQFGLLNHRRRLMINFVGHCIQEVSHLSGISTNIPICGREGRCELTGFTNHLSPPNSNQPRCPPQDVVIITP